MHLARKLLLLAIAAAAAMAITAPGASATSGIEVTIEPGTTHCPQVFLDGDHGVSGGCLVHGRGLFIVYEHIAAGEQQVSLCDIEYNVRINENGSGWMYSQSLPNANCPFAPCDEAAPEHTKLAWRVQLREAAGVKLLRTTYCLRIKTTPEGTVSFECMFDYTVTDNGNHAYSLSANQAPCINLGGVNEISAVQMLESPTGIEIGHQ